MKLDLKKYSLLMALLLLHACASVDGPLYSEALYEVHPDKSTIVIFRQASGIWPLDFYIDGRKFVTLDIGGYSYIIVEPGLHSITVASETNNNHLGVNVYTVVGEAYFVTEAMNMNGQYKPVFRSSADSVLREKKFKLQRSFN